MSGSQPPTQPLPRDPTPQSRKFGPIYDAISAENFREALRRCDRKEVASTNLAKVGAP